MASFHNTPPYSGRNSDPPLKTETVDASSTDFTPTTKNALIVGLNCSTAGTVYLMDRDGNTIIEYLNTGWNPCTASQKVLHNVAATGVPIAAKMGVTN